MSSRFAEMVAEERRGRFFGLFDTRELARAWLEQSDSQSRRPGRSVPSA
jgi:hypothetical protein